MELEPEMGCTTRPLSFLALTMLEVSAVCMICTPFDCTACRRVAVLASGRKTILSR